MTEDEAKTKWCPMVRVDLYISNRDLSCVGNRSEHNTISDRCIGSACMMWRPRLIAGDAVGGHCGLAEKPSGY